MSIIDSVVDLTGNSQPLNGCLGCEIISGNIKPFGGILYKSKNFCVTQDLELPIEGFIIISSIRHVEKLNQLNDEERTELISLAIKITDILTDNDICNDFNLILEEKPNVHFHMWVMPRHQWMQEQFGKVLKNIKPIQDYAINNMRTPENFAKIQSTCNLLKTELNK